MSYITDIILSFKYDCSIEEEHAFNKLLNQYPNKDRPFNIVIIHNETPNHVYDRFHFFSGMLCLGSYNHFDIDDFISYLKLLRWENPQTVQVFARSDFQGTFTVYDVFSDEESEKLLREQK